MLAIKNLDIGVNTFARLSWTQSFEDGWKPIVINITIVINKKLTNWLSSQTNDVPLTPNMKND